MGGLERLLSMATLRRHWESRVALRLVTLSARIRHLCGGSLIISNCLPLRFLNSPSYNPAHSQRTLGTALYASFVSDTAVYSSHGSFQNRDTKFSKKTSASLVSARSRRSHLDKGLTRHGRSIWGAKSQQRERQIILLNRNEVVG